MLSRILLFFALLFFISKTEAQKTSKLSLNRFGSALSGGLYDTGTNYSSLPQINWVLKLEHLGFSSTYGILYCLKR
jgi:hypothetical protein